MSDNEQAGYEFVELTFIGNITELNCLPGGRRILTVELTDDTEHAPIPRTEIRFQAVVLKNDPERVARAHQASRSR